MIVFDCEQMYVSEIKCMETRKRRRPSGGTLCRQKKSRRLLPYVPCTDPQRRLEQMASLATALTSLGVEFTDSLSYGLAPRSANRADNEKGGMQVHTAFRISGFQSFNMSYSFHGCMFAWLCRHSIGL